MALFYLSNNGNHEKIKKEKISLGFPISGECKESGFDFTIFHKLKVNNENYYQTGADFVAVTGSVIYKGLIGLPALEEIYHDFDGSVQELRNNMIGNYAVIIKRNKRIWIFCEEYYAYDIFYSKLGDSWVISNDLYLIYSNHDKIALNVNGLLEFVYIGACVGSETLCKDICRLSGNEYISINLQTSEFAIKEIAFEWRRPYDSYENSVSEVVANLSQTAKVLSNVYASTSICMTGGLDSRISLASFLSEGFKPTLLYGIGNSIITDTFKEDRDIVNKISDIFDLDLKLLDWSNPPQIDSFWDYYKNKYGILSLICQASDSIMKSLENDTEQFVTYGYYGEMYRNISWIESQKRLTVEQYVRDYLLKLHKGDAILKLANINFEEFVDNIVLKYKKVLKFKFKVDAENLSIDDIFYLELERRSNCDNIMVNFSNRINYSISLMGQYQVLRNCNVPMDLMKDSKFMLDIINTISKDVMSIPFFSHCRVWNYNTKDNTLKLPISTIMREKSIAFLADVLPVSIKKMVKMSLRILGVKSYTELESMKTYAYKYLSKDYSGEFIDEIGDARVYLYHAMLVDIFNRTKNK